MKTKLNIHTPVIKNVKSNIKKINKQASDIYHKIPESTARFELELNAERLSPQEYISARNYISRIELSELFKSEF